MAIDGPAGAGKSTLARALATGSASSASTPGPCTARWRGRRWSGGSTWATREAVAALARSLRIELSEQSVLVDGADASAGIRSAAVDAPRIGCGGQPRSAPPNWCPASGSGWARHGGGVVEGRDIGTVVLPDADLKIYLTAVPDERAKRRAGERGRVELAEVAAALDRRDALDSSRPVSPLPAPDRAAPDAIVVDSTGKPADKVLEEVLVWL